MSKISIPTLLATLMLLGCAGTTDKWQGDLDAVFSYRTDQRVTVVHEIKPATRCEVAGLKVGDVVLAVDGKDLSGVSVDQVLTAMRGPTGTVATLTVQRDSEILTFEIERSPRAEAKGK